MATKIQLRRDLSANWVGTNPILAQGEPGVELDTKKMKVGDGVTAWNSLEYVATDAGENTQQNMFVKMNGLDNSNWYNWAGVVSVSTDGLNWTPGTFNMENTYGNGFDVRGFAVGGGRIVYHGREDSISFDEDYYSLRWAYNPFDKPNLPIKDGGDITRRGPNGESIEWYNVRYVGGVFVAVGSYYNSLYNNYNYPYALYSTDGDSWTKINIDETYAYDLILAERNANNNDVDGIEIQDVSYGDGGWLFGLHWGWDGTNTNRTPAGSFFTTDLSSTLGSSSFINSIPGTYISAFDGHGWVAWTNYNTGTGGAAMYFNSSTDPRSGSWRMVDVNLAAQNLTGINSNGCIGDVVAGVVGGVSWIVVGLTNQGALATNDQGVTWRMIKTSSDQLQLTHVSNTNPMYIDNYDGSTPSNGEKVTISGSNISQLNGTFWARYYNGPSGYHTYYYLDSAFANPLDATSWGNVTVSVDKYVTVKYRQHVIEVDNTTDLVIGMVADQDNFYPRSDVDDPNVIVSIDSDKNTVTMKYPYMHYDDDFTVTFRPLLNRSLTDGLVSLAYGDGAFVGFGWNSLSAYRTDDMTTWKRSAYAAETQSGSEGLSGSPWSYNYDNSVFYGAVTTSNALIINNSETTPGFASFLSVGDNFNMTVASGDPQYTEGFQQYLYGTSMINMDPTQGAWNISNSFGPEGYWDMTSINNYTTSVETYSTEGYYTDPTNMYGAEGYGEGYLNNSVQIRSWNNTWRFDDYNGLLLGNGITSRYNSRDNGNGGSVYTNDYNVIMNGPFTGNSNSWGEGYAQVEWDGGTNFVKVNYHGTTINTEGYSWNFSDDCNGDDWGVIYNPESTNIQIPGYWKIGDYFYDWENAYIQATDWAYPGPGDVKINTGNYGGNHHFVFTRFGQLDMGINGSVQSEGYWYIGDSEGYTSFTYMAATNNIDNDAKDVLIAADDIYWYFNRDGNFQLPPGGDIVDDNYISVLNKDMPQNAVSAAGDYTLVIGDRGKHIYKTNTGSIYIPTNASVAFPIGTCITLVTGSAHSTTIAPVDTGTTTLILSKFGTDNEINIPADTYVTILKIATDKWIVQT